MALESPGVEVTIIDQSQYLPATSTSVPLLVIATAQNKSKPSGTAVAPGTTAANANKMYTITSQRDLVDVFGNPFFYKTTNGTAIQGYELNEYGLFAAYSLLGSTNRCYILRADIDLGQLVGTLSRPVGSPDDGAYWLDTTNSAWGIYEFNAATGVFVNKTPIVLVDSSDLTGSNYPLDSIGNIGDYAVVPLEVSDYPQSDYTFFFKTRFNTWEPLGSTNWASSLYTVVGSTVTTPMTSGAKFNFANYDGADLEITVISGTVTQQINDIVDQINAFEIEAITAYNVGNSLCISVSNPQSDDLPNPYIALSGDGSDTTALDELGLEAKSYYQPIIVNGPSAEMPLWTSSQALPHPTGSVWIKTSSAGNGMNLVVSKYSSSTASWRSVVVNTYAKQFSATADLDSSGGKNIPKGTVFAQYSDSNAVGQNPIILWERFNTGSTVIVTGKTGSDISYTSGNVVTVGVTTPGSTSFDEYTFTTTGTDAATFVQDWQGANILNTTIRINSDDAIEIAHTLGGEIVISDFTNGQTTGVLAGIGLTVETNNSANLTNSVTASYTNVGASQASVTRGGSVLDPSSLNYPTGFSVSITNGGGIYYRDLIGAPGTNYEVGDIITIAGATIAGATPANNLDLIVTSVSALTGGVTGVEVNSGTARVNYNPVISNWIKMTYTPNEGSPSTAPSNGTYWYYSTATQADIMVQKNGSWIGYKNTNYDSTGHPSVSGSNATDPLGPIMSATTPTTQTDGTALVYGDLWVDTTDLENYPVVYRWQSVDTVDQWVKIDTTDQISSSGVLFADARWANSGSVDPVSDPLTSITTLLTSNYLDLDAPDPALYPQGMLLWNTRRSGYNVKKFTTNYFTSAKYPGETLPTFSYTWVSASGSKTNGMAYMGRKAQRNIVVQSLKAAISTNTTIREEDYFYNLISCPNYPELQPDMITLNNDRNQTAFIVGDTPMRLSDSATDIQNWANNAAGASSTGEDGLVTRDTYMGLFYPSGLATELTGSEVVVPASHMMLRTILRNDTVAYPWLAPAGTRRGNIDNASSIGYIDAATGEYVSVKNRVSIRDVLYTNFINPLTYFTGVGNLNYGNKSSFNSQSALDRINVARLIAYIRYNVQIAARPFVFEPNDSLTRQELSGVVETLFIDLVSKRGLYDYLVVCDESNNTPARIDRNELWVDIAIKPVKAVEYIYIPVRVLNTGDPMAIV